MRLPRGVTGFRSAKDPLLPEMDVGVFKGHCYSAARALGGKVRSFEMPYGANTNNHAIATLDLRTGPVSVLLNACFPLIGFAEPVSAGELSIHFTDAPELAETFRSFSVYEVLKRATLEQPLTEEAIADLSEAERKEWSY